MSDNFPNISTNGGDMGFEVRDPNNSALDMDDSNLPSTGKSRIQKSADAPHPTEMVGYGYMSAALKDVGRADSNNGTLADNNNTGNTSGIPAAQPIDPVTFGDPNDTGLDFKDGPNANTVTIRGGGTGDISRRGFDKAAI